MRRSVSSLLSFLIVRVTESSSRPVAMNATQKERKATNRTALMDAAGGPTADPNNEAVGNTTIGDLKKVLTNEIGSLSTPKGRDPKELQNGAGALANALINNANERRPNEVAPTQAQCPRRLRRLCKMPIRIGLTEERTRFKGESSTEQAT